MNDFTLKTNRGQMLKSLMRSPETAKLLKEAISSPLGSTSRIKAKKIFSIMSKLHTYNEGFGGQGGPGDPTAPASPLGTAQSQTPDFTPKGMVMFNKIPKTKIVYGNSLNLSKYRQINHSALYCSKCYHSMKMNFQVDKILKHSTQH